MSADIVRRHFRNGDLTLARAAAEGALRSEPDSADLWALLARARCRLGQPREAIVAAERAAALSAHWEVALALGEALIATGEPFRARAVLADALATLRDGGTAGGAGAAATGDPFADRAEAEVWLGVALADALRTAGDPEQGLAVAARAVTFAEQRFGASAPEVAEALYALGTCHHAAGQPLRATEALRRSLSVRRAATPDHPDVAATLDALGLVARAQQRPQEAVRLHREALALWEARVGAESGPVGACRHALAQALHRTGDFAGARDEMAAAVRITAAAFGRDHVDTWIARFEHGRFDMDNGRVEEGLAEMEDARRVVRERLGADHPVVKAMNRWL